MLLGGSGAAGVAICEELRGTAEISRAEKHFKHPVKCSSRGSRSRPQRGWSSLDWGVLRTPLNVEGKIRNSEAFKSLLQCNSRSVFKHYSAGHPSSTILSTGNSCKQRHSRWTLKFHSKVDIFGHQVQFHMFVIQQPKLCTLWTFRRK